MKNKTLPTKKERMFKGNDYIVSKTNTKGQISYANRVFMEISDYSERELLGVQQNILRHPDMPRGTFQSMWETISAGKEFFAYVINLCKNGDHYWVFANITADYDTNGNIIGYFSVRRLPRPEAVAVMIPIYAQMLAEEQRAGPKRAIEASQALLMNIIKEAGHDTYETFILSV